jgi:hypothetical protein
MGSFASFAGPVFSAVGGLISGGKGADAARAQAEALRAAGLRSSQMASFRPIGLRTGFGSSNFRTNELGQVEEAGYELTPELQSLRNRFISGATGAPRAITTQVPQVPEGYSLTDTTGGPRTMVMPKDGFTYAYGPSGDRIEVPLTAQTSYEPTQGYDPTRVQQLTEPIYGGASSLFNLGGSYLGANPQEVAAKYISDRQGLLQPSRAAEFGRINARNFATGRGGLGVQTATGGAPTNPALQAYYNSIFQQDKALAAEADTEAMNRIRFGGELYGAGGKLAAGIPSLFSGSFLPIETQLNMAKSIESLGQNPYQMSLDLAAAQAGAGARSGELYLRPQADAASAYSRYQSYSPLGTAFSGLGSSMSGGGGFGSLFGGGGGGGGGYSAAPYAPINPGFGSYQGGYYGSSAF